MADSSDLYDVWETSGPPPWDDQQHQCLEDPDSMEHLRRKIKYYFMNPCEKYHARGRKPWKLVLQLIKIVIITIQVESSDVTKVGCWSCWFTCVDCVFLFFFNFISHPSWCLSG